MSEHPNGAGEWFRSLFGKKEKDDSYYHRRPASGFSGARSHLAPHAASQEEVPAEAPSVHREVPAEPVSARPEVTGQPAVPAQPGIPEQPSVDTEAPAVPAPETEPAPSAAQISLDLPEEIVGENWPKEVLSVARDPEEWDTEEEVPSQVPSSEGQISLEIGQPEGPAAPVPAEPRPVRSEPVREKPVPAPLTTEELETPRAPIPSGMDVRGPRSPRDLPPEAEAEDFEEPEDVSFTEKPPRNRAVGCLLTILILLILICGLGFGAYYLYPDETAALYRTYIAPTAAPTAVIPEPTPEPVLTKEAWTVSWGDVPLGTVEDADAVLGAYAEWRTGVEKTVGMELSFPGRLSASPVTVEEGYEFTDPESILNEARNRTNRTFNGCVVMIEGHDVFAMAAPEKFRAVLEKILEDAKASALKTLATETDPNPEMPPYEWEFSETIRTEKRMVSPLDILTESEALERLRATANTAQTVYTVQNGDTLAKIAARFHTSQEALMEANPGLTSPDVIKVGQELNLRGDTRTLNLTLSLTITEVQVIPYTTQKVNDGDLAKGTEKVTQEGEDGQETIVSRDSFLNGEFVSHQILSKTTDKEMVEEIIHVGTYVKDTGSNPGGRRFPYPVSGYRISSPFGWRQSTQSYHKGIDLAVPIGTPIYAADSGTVAFSGNASGYGLVVYINHSGGYQTRYGHCSRLVVKGGDTVRKGQLIAYSGNTGKSSGPHCHFEIRVNGTAVNPAKYQ